MAKLTVGSMKEVARRWVTSYSEGAPGFVGALTHGSVNWLADDAPFSASSDVDILLVFDTVPGAHKSGKTTYEGYLLEITPIESARLQDTELILVNHHLAGNICRATILHDPTGQLGGVQSRVRSDYAKRPWVTARARNAFRKISDYLNGFHHATALHDRVMGWMFAAGICTHVLLAAGLQNSTVRKRYLAVRELLSAYDETDFYELLLAQLGCQSMNAVQVSSHLTALGQVFDAAQSVPVAPFPFASDISPLARAIAIEGSEQLIAAGDHREAVFWIGVTFSRCRKIIDYHDFSAWLPHYEAGYWHVLQDLGIGSENDLVVRAEELSAFLPQLWAKTETILSKNPAIQY